ncbi:hypothetical protein BDV25DRAFT_159195 [Aspergillus avenaceus]|uniref:BTB domain-containing protein n=1 Tax=Aspergillus avenaceus TaxID=36643 RepID=A0A5N6TNU0_ASPAV|nr:hypothetical protein BDV25DRAFT_159195 [Aspergillus avenaceus]
MNLDDPDWFPVVEGQRQDATTDSVPRPFVQRGASSWKPNNASEDSLKYLCSGLLLSQDADTLLYIDPPPQTKPSTLALPRSLESIPHRVHSRKLLETNSSYFKNLFEPRVQARTISRRHLEGKLTNGIKYVIDLTPPSVEDDAVIFLTELSCPRGIRTWAKFQELWSLPSSRVGGIDEVELPDNRSGKASFSNENNLGLPMEYSTSRHRSGIENIIHALEECYFWLDTPCKLWTFFALAKIFEIATHATIMFPILAWIYDGSNSRLIELHPEITYRIGFGIQCDTLCRDSFSVLVSEEALLLLANSDKPPVPSRPQWTFHGRHRESLLDDDELQRIEYASKSFLDHVVDRFISLAGTEMRWLSMLPMFQRILNYTPTTQQEQDIVNELVQILKEYVRSRIVQWLERREDAWTPGAGMARGEEYKKQALQHAHPFMRYPERILSRLFWKRLRNENFIGDVAPEEDSNFYGSTLADLGRHVPAFKSQTNARITQVNSFEVNFVIQKFNNLPGVTNMYEQSFVYEGMISSQYTRIFSPKKHYFALDAFLSEVRSYVTVYANAMFEVGKEATFMEMTDTVTRLTDNEFKYLPLWAGGNDDGTGGVFMDQNIPILEAGGFSTPGPAIHIGSTVSVSDSFSMIGGSEVESTIHGASHGATDGYGTDLVSIDSKPSSHKDKESVSGHHGPASQESYIAADDFLVYSSADDDDGAFDCSSDSSGTIVLDALGHDFEELELVENERSPPAHVQA